MPKETKMQFVVSNQCGDSDEILGFYDVKGKKFYIKPGYHDSFEPKTINAMLDTVLEKGTGSSLFRALQTIPDFKKAWAATEKGLKTNINQGDQLIMYEENRPTVFVAGELVEWKKHCNRNTGKGEIIAQREVVDHKTGKTQVIGEDRLYPAKDLVEWEEGRELVKKLTSGLKKKSVVGLSIFYKGVAYRY